MTRQKEQKKTREEIGKGIKWEPWDSRQEGDIKHPRPPYGGEEEEEEEDDKQETFKSLTVGALCV